MGEIAIEAAECAAAPAVTSAETASEVPVGETPSVIPPDEAGGEIPVEVAVAAAAPIVATVRDGASPRKRPSAP